MAAQTNAFDEFDNAPTGAAQPTAGANAFDQFDQAAPTNPQSKGILANIASGANTQAANLVGLPKELIKIPFQMGAGALDYLGGDTVGGLHTAAQAVRSAPDYIPLADIQQTKEALTGVGGFPTDVTVPVQRDRWVKDPTTGRPVRQSQVERAPLPATVQPQDTGERIAYGTGAGLGAAATFPMQVAGMAGLAPEVAASPLAQSSIPLAQDVGRLVMPATGRALVQQAGLGTVSGGAGAAAAEAAPEPYKPYADLVGQLAGGGLYTGADLALAKLSDIARPVLTDRLAPMVSNKAATALAERQAGTALQQASSDPAQLRETLANLPEPTVPGSQPTLAESAPQDVGLSALQRTTETQNPVPFQQRRGEQVAARVAAVEGTAPQEAQPQAVGDLLRGRLAAIDAETDAATTAAQGRLEQAQGALPQPSMGTQGEYGAAVRQAAADARTASKGRLGTLWDAVDPTGKAALNVSETVNAAKQIVGDMPGTAKEMGGDELGAFQAASGMSPVSTFQDLSGLRSRITDAIRAFRSQPGNDQAVRRLTMLKNALDDNLSNEATRLGTSDASVIDRVNQLAGEANAANAGAARSEVQAGATSGTMGSEHAPDQAGAVPAIHGTGTVEAQGPGGLQNPSGTAGVPEATPVDTNLPARYEAARAATVENKQTFNQGPVGQILAPGSQGAQYRIPDPAVMDRVLSGKAGDAENFQALSRAIGQQNAQNVVRDYAAFDLRRSAMNPDGSINPARMQRWLAKNGEGLDQVPGLRDQFADVGRAQQALDDVSAQRAQVRSDYENSAARFYLNGADPVAAAGKAMGNPDEFGRLVDMVSGDDAARQGLKRAVVDHMMGKTQSNTPAPGQEIGAIKPDQFQNYLKQNRASLGKLFTPQELATMDAVAKELQTAQAVRNSAQLPGRSNTAQDLLAAAKNERTSPLGEMVREGAASAAGAAAAGPLGAAGASFTSKLWNAAKRAGVDNTNALVREAMLNPEFARVLLSKVPAKPAPYLMERFARRIINTAGIASSDRQANQ